MKFCVFTDLHYDSIPDGERRVQELLEHCRKENVDFIVELGDLCHPRKENQCVMEQFRGVGISCYFSLGNHNMDFCDKAVVLGFLGLDRGYYAVVRENVKFIFLDANDEVVVDGKPGPYISLEQIEWLEQELSDGGYYYVICTHQSLANDYVTQTKIRGIVNRAQVREVLERQKEKILFCINGHEHGTGVKEIGGIYYYRLNSASYYWQNVREMYLYGEEIHKKYPYLKNLVLYREALHVIVEIDEKMNVNIRGMEGHYLTVGPEEIGMGNTWNGVSILPRTESLAIKCADTAEPSVSV